MFDAKGLVRPRDFLEGPVHAAIAILRHPALGKDGLKSILYYLRCLCKPEKVRVLETVLRALGLKVV